MKLTDFAVSFVRLSPYGNGSQVAVAVALVAMETARSDDEIETGMEGRRVFALMPNFKAFEGRTARGLQSLYIH
jgi:hypothetical protein